MSDQNLDPSSPAQVPDNAAASATTDRRELMSKLAKFATAPLIVASFIAADATDAMATPL